MRNWAKFGALLVALSVSLVALGQAIPAADYKLIGYGAGYTILRIQNNTAGNLNVFVIMATDCVVVDKALAYGASGPVVSKIEGACQLWKITLAGNGLAPKAFLEIAIKAPAVTLRNVYGFLVK